MAFLTLCLDHPDFLATIWSSTLLLAWIFIRLTIEDNQKSRNFLASSIGLT